MKLTSLKMELTSPHQISWSPPPARDLRYPNNEQFAPEKCAKTQ